MERHFYHFLFLLFIFFTTCTYAEKWPKIYDTQTSQWLTMEDVEEKMLEHRVVFVGEKHGHRWGHRIEKILLERFLDVHGDIAVGLEMFERDVQSILDGYMDGQISESFFLAHSRPWKNYNTDYRPLVEFAKSVRMPVLALNVPRRYASFVAKNKEEILFAMPQEEQTYMAQHVLAPHDRYFEKFIAAMGGAPTEMLEPYYRAQCFKDDTMAKSIAVFLSQKPQKKVISYMGSFHCDEHLGTVQRFVELMPRVKPLVISIIATENSDEKINVDDYKDLADLVFFAPANPGTSQQDKNFTHGHGTKKQPVPEKQDEKQAEETAKNQEETSPTTNTTKNPHDLDKKTDNSQIDNEISPDKNKHIENEESVKESTDSTIPAGEENDNASKNK